MDQKNAKDLCLSLLAADTEDDVIGILKQNSLWDDPQLWRYYGDTSNNFSPIGNQQSRPEAALVEKIINAVDARLMNECEIRGINPESSEAPTSIRNAVATFFDEHPATDAGRIREWSRGHRAKIADGITLAATGLTPQRGGANPCFSIADIGEGQTPDRMPETFLSLDRKNKQSIRFVQGRFNMGGTGVLPFCGQHKLQLIITKRNPALLNPNTSTHDDHLWGFTIVRRETGIQRGSIFTYLAPLGTAIAPRKGGVLRFDDPALKIFPDGAEPYARAVPWGSLVKLYEFQLSGGRAHILRKDGLLHRLDLLLPDIAIPIRLHECRVGYRGHEGSFDTPLTGISVRLDDDRGENLEDDFPSSSPLRAEGEEMVATIYAFKKGKGDTYKSNEGIIFTYNGQTHGHLTKDFFSRKAAGRFNRIADSILIVVDCSRFTEGAYEDLFMNSRDRLRNGRLRDEIESQLEDLVKHNEPLRALKDRRKREELAEQIGDSKPLETVIESLLKHSPTLATLFLKGTRLSNPLKPDRVKGEAVPFCGRPFPTYFRIKNHTTDEELRRTCAINFRSRITFETDATNDYFSRKTNPGTFSLVMVDGTREVTVANYAGPNLHSGAATLSVRLPANCDVGDEIHYVARITDSTQMSPFANRFAITVKPEMTSTGGGSSERKPPTDKPGDDREIPSGLALPTPHLVYEKDWGAQNPPFDKYTALRLTIDQDEAENDTYDFFVNMDNLYLQTELKAATNDTELLRTRFQCALVLVGLALLHDDRAAHRAEKRGGDGEQRTDVSIEKKIESVTRALAPILLPAIQTLGALDLGAEPVDESGEAA